MRSRQEHLSEQEDIVPRLAVHDSDSVGLMS